MNILIIGAGRVGASVAENLSVNPENNITIIDSCEKRLSFLQSRLDVRCVLGDGSLPKTLNQAEAQNIDILIACTVSDATNLVACKIAKDKFNIPHRICRLRASSYLYQADFIKETFSVNSIISPENSVTEYLYHLVQFPEAHEVVSFEQGKISLINMRVRPSSRLIGRILPKNNTTLPELEAQIVEICRDNEYLDIEEENTIQAGDEILLAIDYVKTSELIHKLQKETQSTHHVMIAGGGNIGLRLAKLLDSEGYTVKIIEKDPDRCQELCEELDDHVLVLEGNATDEKLLHEEGIDGLDAWLSLTNEDEDNIMSSLLAKRLGAKRVISLIARQSYGELMQGSMIDIAVSPSQATISSLMTHVRDGSVKEGHRINLGQSEALKFKVIGNSQTSNVAGRTLSEINLPKGSRIACIIKDGEFTLPSHVLLLEEGDGVIVYAQDRDIMTRVEKLFRVSTLFT